MTKCEIDTKMYKPGESEADPHAALMLGLCNKFVANLIRACEAVAESPKKAQRMAMDVAVNICGNICWAVHDRENSKSFLRLLRHQEACAAEWFEHVIKDFTSKNED